MAGPGTYPGNGPLVNLAAADPAVLDQLLDLSISNLSLSQRLGVGESSVRRWRRKHHRELRRPGAVPVEPDAVLAGRFTDDDRQRLHERLDAVLDEVTEGEITGLTVRQWEGFVRGEDGTPEVVQLQGVKLDVKVAEVAPDWPLTDRPRVLLKVIPPGRPRPRHPRDRLAVLLPDPQIGFRMFDNGELDPFHDESAIDVALQVTADAAPDEVICLGDFEDFAEFGRYTQEAAFARTTQKGIDRGHELCAQLRHAAPGARIRIMEGNHDRRAEKRILETNMAAWGLRRAADTTGWPVFSVPYLCAFDVFGIEYVGGYPAGEVWITDELRCIHGMKVRSGGSTAAAVVRDDGVSTVFGHVHRIELQHLTRRVRGAGKNLLAATPGCLCRIDGAVPSVKGSTTLDGRPAGGAENWQQGLAVVEYREGRGSFALTLVHIDTWNGYETRVSGRAYFPRRKKPRTLPVSPGLLPYRLDLTYPAHFPEDPDHARRPPPVTPRRAPLSRRQGPPGHPRGAGHRRGLRRRGRGRHLHGTARRHAVGHRRPRRDRLAGALRCQPRGSRGEPGPDLPGRGAGCRRWPRPPRRPARCPGHHLDERSGESLRCLPRRGLHRHPRVRRRPAGAEPGQLGQRPVPGPGHHLGRLHGLRACQGRPGKRPDRVQPAAVRAAGTKPVGRRRVPGYLTAAGWLRGLRAWLERWTDDPPDCGD